MEDRLEWVLARMGFGNKKPFVSQQAIALAVAKFVVHRKTTPRV